MFYTYVAYVLFRCYVCLHWFSSVFSFFSSVSSAFRRMLQLLYLDVSKADWVYISPPCLLLHRLDVFSRCRQGICTTPWPGPSKLKAPPPSPLVARAVRARVESVKQSAARGHPSGRPGASTADKITCVLLCKITCIWIYKIDYLYVNLVDVNHADFL
jgi:hypothetical protein